MSKPTSDCRATERNHPWPMVRLGDVCEIIAGQSPEGSYYTDESCYTEFHQGSKSFGTRELQVSGVYTKKETKIAKPGSLLISVRAPVGDLNITTRRVCIGRGLAALIPDDSLSRDFLWLFLTSATKAVNDAAGAGSCFSSLSRSQLSGLEIPLPPLSEQKEIVARLERELAAVEKMKKGFEALAETAKAEFKAELKEVFDELDGKMDGQARSSEQGHLSWRELGEVCDVRDGTHDTPAKCDNGYLLLTSKNVRKGKVDKTNAYCISASDYAAINKRSGVDQWDVLFSMIGTVGETAIVDEPPDFAIKNMGLFKTHADELLARWIKYYFDSPVAKQLILDRLKGSNQKFLSLGVLRAFPLALTDRDSMLRLVTRIDAAKVRAEKLEAKAREGVAVCETMRKAILKEAFE